MKIRVLLVFLLAFVLASASSMGFASEDNSPSEYDDALALFRLHYNAEALEILNSKLSAIEDPNWTRRVSFLKGALHVRMGDPEAAKNALRQLQSGSNPLSNLARAQWVLACIQNGDYAEGLNTLESLQSAGEDPLWMATQKALLLTGDKQNKNAIAAWKKLLTIHRRDTRKDLARFHLAKLYEAEGQPQKAKSQRRKLVVHHPGTQLGLQAWKTFPGNTLTTAERATRAKKLWDARRYEAAIHAYEALLDAPKWRDEAHLKIARLYSERLRTHYDKAEFHFSKASQSKNKIVAGEGLYKLGLVYGKQHRYEEAIKTLRAFRRRFPSDGHRTEAGFEIGRHMAEAGQFEKAGAHLSKWIKTESKLSKGIYTRYLWFAGWAYYRGQNWKKALSVFSELSNSRKTLVGDKALYWTARAQDHQGKRKEAKATLFRLLKRFPHSYYSWLSIRRLEKWGEDHPFSALDFTHKKEVQRSPWNLPVSSKRGKRILMELRDLAAVGELSKARDYWKRHQKAVRPLMTAAAFNQLAERLKLSLEHFYTRRKNAFSKNGRLRTQYPSDANISRWRTLFPRAFQSMTAIAAQKEGLPEWLIYSHMLQESRYGTHMVSGANAYGVIQILPSTGRLIAEDLNLDFEAEWLFDPGYNIRLAAWYLGALAKRFQGQLPLAIASYNGGPRLLSFHLKQYPGLDMEELIESLPAHQSRNYARKVMEHLYRYLSIYTSPQTGRNVMEKLISDEINTAEETEPAY